MSIRRKSILIIDDSPLACRILERALGELTEVQVIGMAHDGLEGLQKIKLLNPDLVLLDIEMPVMDGMQTLQALRSMPSPPLVLMVSALTKRHAQATIDALLLGASDYICKPSNQQGFSELKRKLCQKVSSLLTRVSHHTPTSGLPKTVLPKIQNTRPQVIAIAASTGGPEALKIILSALPSWFSIPVLIVQHMTPLFTSMLATSLNRQCSLPVKEVTQQTPIHAPGIWIAPGDRHLVLRTEHHQVMMTPIDAPRLHSCRPAADLLFQSVATTYDSRCLTIVLTGMGQDGLMGCRLVQQNGGSIIAQDERSSVVWGMPKAVIEANIGADELPLQAIGHEILRRCGPPPKDKKL